MGKIVFKTFKDIENFISNAKNQKIRHDTVYEAQTQFEDTIKALDFIGAKEKKEEIEHFLFSPINSALINRLLFFKKDINKMDSNNNYWITIIDALSNDTLNDKIKFPLCVCLFKYQKGAVYEKALINFFKKNRHDYRNDVLFTVTEKVYKRSDDDKKKLLIENIITPIASYLFVSRDKRFYIQKDLYNKLNSEAKKKIIKNLKVFNLEENIVNDIIVLGAVAPQDSFEGSLVSLIKRKEEIEFIRKYISFPEKEEILRFPTPHREVYIESINIKEMVNDHAEISNYLITRALSVMFSEILHSYIKLNKLFETINEVLHTLKPTNNNM